MRTYSGIGDPHNNSSAILLGLIAKKLYAGHPLNYTLIGSLMVF